MNLLLQEIENDNTKKIDNINIMKASMICFLALLSTCQIFLSKASLQDSEECLINRIDLSQDRMLCRILEDVLAEDSINGIDDDVFYDMNVTDYKAAVMVSISRLSKSFIYKDKNCIGYSNYKGRFVMVNGEERYLTGIKPLKDSIRVKCMKRIPVPDGIKNWTYKIEDGLCTRFFKGMGFLHLPEFKYAKDSLERIPVITLPNRKTNNIKR